MLCGAAVNLERTHPMRKLALVGSIGILLAGTICAEEYSNDTNKAATAEALKVEIEALRAPKVAWREIQWKSCLLEGLRESREKNKPVLLWIFIDRPADDARC
jgi:hypothetical protein